MAEEQRPRNEQRDLPQRGPLKLPDYYFYGVGGIPVRFLPTEDGGMDVERLDVDTGEFVRDLSLMPEILFNPGTSTPIERVGAAAFQERVEELRTQLKRRESI